MARTAKTQALAPVDVTFPESPAVRRARIRLDVVRSATGRLATLAGGTAAAAGLFSGDHTGASLLATAALSCVGLGTLRLWKPDGHQKATASVLYLMPGTGLAALLLAERIVPGIHWSEALALATWTVGTWVARPARIGRRLLSPPPSTAPAPVEEPEPRVVSDHPAARWWAVNAAISGGVAPGTALDDIQQTGEKSMRAIIRSTIAGKPVPNISVRDLSALTDIPEDEISIAPVAGRGAGVRLLTMGKPDQGKDDLTKVWAERIAPKAMPGTRLVSVRVGKPAVANQSDEKSDS